MERTRFADEHVALHGAGGAHLDHEVTPARATQRRERRIPHEVVPHIGGRRDRWLPGLASGELIATSAMSEPGTSSDDVASITTRARRCGGDLVSGAGTFISNGLNSKLIVTAVLTGDTGRHDDVGVMVIERGMKWFERRRDLEKPGTHSQDTELFFNDVGVPAENLLESEVRIVDACPQLHAGARYSLGYPIARDDVDARANRIYGGSDEIMLEIVGRSLEIGDPR